MQEVFWQTPFFADIVQWITFAILLLLVFSPFIVISLKRFRPVKWYYVAITYVVSWFIYTDLSYYLVNSLARYLSHISGFTNIVLSLDSTYFDVGHWLFIFWPLSVFYVVRLLRGSFTFKNFLTALFFAVLIFGGLVWHMFYELSKGFGELLKYF